MVVLPAGNFWSFSTGKAFSSGWDRIARSGRFQYVALPG
jgi:hypothetical protein